MWQKLTKDTRKNLNLQYNALNLLSEIREGLILKAKYYYGADGTKLRVCDGDYVNGFDYLGSVVYKRSSSGLSVDLISFSGGVIKPISNGYDTNFFIKDHLGSVRVVVDDNGTILDQSDYWQRYLGWGGVA